MALETLNFPDLFVCAGGLAAGGDTFASKNEMGKDGLRLHLLQLRLELGELGVLEERVVSGAGGLPGGPTCWRFA